jgi:hypothetical protein
MQVIQEIFDSIGIFLSALKINPMYLVLWVGAGYIQKIYLTKVTKLNEAWKTLILGSLFCVGYALLQRPLADKNTWVEFFASYIFATSLYELFLKDLVNRIILYAQGIINKKLE